MHRAGFINHFGAALKSLPSAAPSVCCIIKREIISELRAITEWWLCASKAATFLGACARPWVAVWVADSEVGGGDNFVRRPLMIINWLIETAREEGTGRASGGGSREWRVRVGRGVLTA